METKESTIRAFRFGYGLPGLNQGFGSPDAMIQQLTRAEPVPANLRAQVSSPRIVELSKEVLNVRLSNGSEKRENKRILVTTRKNYYERDCHDRVVAAVETPSPFFERLVSFWSNHFTVSIKPAGIRFLVGPYEVEAIRPHVMGRFRDMLQAVELHPAMMTYLDLVKSIGPNSIASKREGRSLKGLNENLAREILELHTLGVNGGYDQKDVTNFAKIMTGWTVNHQSGGTEFNVNRAEPGEQIMLGSRFGAVQPDQEAYGHALDFLARHPSTARFIATKLARHFLSDKPDEASINGLRDAFVASDGDLPTVYRTLVNLQASAAEGTSKARTGFEFVVASLRAAQVRAEDLATIDRDGVKRPNPLSGGALVKMAQPLWGALSPAGWSENAEDWLSPTGLAQRLQWIPRVVVLIRDEFAEGFLDRVLGPRASEQTRSVVKAASSRQEAMALVLASPEFNRR